MYNVALIHAMLHDRPCKYMLAGPASTDGTPIPVGDTDAAMARYLAWYAGRGNRRVRATAIFPDGTCHDARMDETFDDAPDALWISTVFLSIDHAFDDGPPVLWETMAYYRGTWGDQWRYTSLAEAHGHHSDLVALIVDHLRRGLSPFPVLAIVPPDTSE